MRRGLAVGLFVAFILPVGQILVGALLAIQIRANIPITAAATFVSNPLTMPPIYIGAYKLGSMLLHQLQADQGSEATTGLMAKMLNVSAQTAVGLLIFGLLFATLGYVVGGLWWRAQVLRRWRKRQRSR